VGSLDGKMAATMPSCDEAPETPGLPLLKPSVYLWCCGSRSGMVECDLSLTSKLFGEVLRNVVGESERARADVVRGRPRKKCGRPG